MKVLNRVERLLERGFRWKPGQDEAELEPLELRKAILRDLLDAVEPRGRGEHVFPYAAVTARVFAEDEHRAQALRAVLDETSLRRELLDELSASGCETGPSVLRVVVQPPTAPEHLVNAYVLEGGSEAELTPKLPSLRPCGRLRVVSGSANCEAFELNSDVVLIGRLSEVLGRKTGKVRRNDIAFAETENSVSRAHARIVFDEGSGELRLYDEPESQDGTFVVRKGREIECDSQRGIALRSGDEVRLGKARLLVEFD